MRGIVTSMTTALKGYGMTDDLLMGIPVSVPAYGKQKKIAEILDELEYRLSAGRREYDTLVKLRNGFMQQLFI